MCIRDSLWPAMKTFVIFLNRLPEYPKTHMHDVEVDLVALKELNTIYNEKKSSKKNN